MVWHSKPTACIRVYALVLLVHQDLYEDDNDAFTCGRAYGGSRGTVLSSARYNPALDVLQGVDKTHPRPVSHCKEFVEAQYSAYRSSLKEDEEKERHFRNSRIKRNNFSGTKSSSGCPQFLFSTAIIERPLRPLVKPTCSSCRSRAGPFRCV